MALTKSLGRCIYYIIRCKLARCYIYLYTNGYTIWLFLSLLGLVTLEGTLYGCEKFQLVQHRDQLANLTNLSLNPANVVGLGSKCHVSFQVT